MLVQVPLDEGKGRAVTLVETDWGDIQERADAGLARSELGGDDGGQDRVALIGEYEADSTDGDEQVAAAEVDLKFALTLAESETRELEGGASDRV